MNNQRLRSGTTMPPPSPLLSMRNLAWGASLAFILLSGGGNRAWGQCWSKQAFTLSKGLNDVFFVNASIGYAVGESGTILKSTNGGLNWDIMPSPTVYTLYSTHFVSATTGWVVGNDAVIYKTMDGGATWELQNEDTNMFSVGFPFWDVYFINVNEGWTVGLGGTMLKTINGGGNWTPVNTPAADLGCVYFANSAKI